jgi:sarcosine oxidase subunit beta
MSSQADVVVIGAGVIGSSVAYHLAKKGLQVTLVERGDISDGTSSRCDGDVLIHDKMPGYDTEIAALSQKMFPELVKEIDYDFDYYAKGSVLLIESEAELDAARGFCEQQQANGMPFRMMDQYEVHQDNPNTALDIVGAIEITPDGSIDPMALAFGLAEGAKRLGARTLTYSPVVGIELEADRSIRKVITEREEIVTKKVVNAAGVWAKHIGKLVGLEIPIEPRQGQILVAENTFEVARRKTVEFGYMMAKFGSSQYKRQVDADIEKYGVAFVFEPTMNNNFLIGSSRAFLGEDISSSLEIMQALARRALRFFPVIKDINIIRSYSGIRPFTPDHFPIVSPSEDVKGFYVAAGHEGDGIGLAPITGKLIAQMVCGEPTELNVERLALSRFTAHPAA